MDNAHGLEVVDLLPPLFLNKLVKPLDAFIRMGSRGFFTIRGEVE